MDDENVSDLVKSYMRERDEWKARAEKAEGNLEAFVSSAQALAKEVDELREQLHAALARAEKAALHAQSAREELDRLTGELNAALLVGAIDRLRADEAEARAEKAEALVGTLSREAEDLRRRIESVARDWLSREIDQMRIRAEKAEAERDALRGAAQELVDLVSESAPLTWSGGLSAEAHEWEKRAEALLYRTRDLIERGEHVKGGGA
jgi:chromosome segregation ATPase